jgi:cysteine desulfurase family protein (TIGR01976 family)
MSVVMGISDIAAQGERIAAEFRASTPALSRLCHGKTPVYLDAPGGSQMPECAARAMSEYIRRGMANRHGAFETSEETEELLAGARRQVTALLGADGYVIVFGQNMTSLSFALATSLARDWAPGGERDQIVVSEIDHHANVDPWRCVAADKQLRLRWLPVDPDLVGLDLGRLDDLITPRCLVTAVGLASNAVGTIQDVARIAGHTRQVGGLTIVDGVHAVPHLPVDVAGLGADVFLFSAYKFFGPHIGIMAIREELAERVRFYKVAPAGETGPDRAELGSQNHEAVAGLSASLEFLASLGEGRTLGERLAGSMRAIQAYEDGVARSLQAGLESLPGVRIFRAPEGAARTPTVAFTVAGADPAKVARACADEAVFVTNGDFYATTLAGRLGVAESGGWVRAGLAPYIGRAEVGRALTVLERARWS